MKNISSLNTNDINSPKTPGGISKSLLTPCRRLGLSRSWRRSGPSPFISPLSSTSNDSQIEKKETRKRKERLSEENVLEAANTTESDNNKIASTPTVNVNICDDKKSLTKSHDLQATMPCITNSQTNVNINNTPSRNVRIPLRKKPKVLLSTIDNTQEYIPLNLEQNITCKNNDINLKENIEHVSLSAVVSSQNINTEDTENCFTKEISNKHSDPENSESLIVSKPVKSKSKNKKSLPKNTEKYNTLDNDVQLTESEKHKDIVYTIKDKSPNDLKKECVVVIQRKLFQNVKHNSPIDNTVDVSKTSDTEEDNKPLIKLQKQNSNTISDKDNDFIENQNDRRLIKSKTTKSPKMKIKNLKINKIKENIVKQTPVPQTNVIDDDDDDFDNRKTILIRKSYEKVTKPTKAKSTGSVTQRDIDIIRNRIEAKKKLLLAQSLTPDTEDLRNLIKKWQKGCQDALMELLDLMKNKFPDKESMNYSEMLQTLKIPPSLVGYDSDNDCFHSPDDTSIILGQFNDL